MPLDMIFFYEKKKNAEGDWMKSKKSPERFSIRFDSSIPEHQRVIEILSNKGRNAAKYIADAVIAYENCNKNSLESTVTEVVNKILGLNAVKSPQKSSSHAFIIKRMMSFLCSIFLN